MKFRTALVALAALLCGLFVVSAADSRARIVRLSDIQGSAQIDRATGQGYEKAFLNMPITEGVKLKTVGESRAEIEFEDGSLIHLVPGTVLQFTELSMRDSGAKDTTVDVQEGLAYFNFAGKKDDEFTVTFGREKAALTQSARFRVDFSTVQSSLAVFSGEVQVNGPSGQVNVAKKQTANFDLGNNDQFELAKNIEPDPNDAWDKQQADYHQRYVASNSYNASPYNYGMSDLNYYGNYMNVAGCGMCWQPFFTNYGWSPFMDGAWMWYPGFGYSWVSAYPWGWMPYHYGSWMFVPGYGWMWQPGASWVAWNQLPLIVNPPRNFVAPRPPIMSVPGTVTVGRGPTLSTVPPRTALIKSNDAGIGVPRGLRNLSQVNRQVASSGSATLHVSRMGGMRTTTFAPHAGGQASSSFGSSHLSSSSSSSHSSSSSSHSSSHH